MNRPSPRPRPRPRELRHDEPPTLAETATVTVSDTVDGTRRRRPPTPAYRSSRVTHTQADPRAVRAAQALLRPGQKLVTVSPTEVWVVNR